MTTFIQETDSRMIYLYPEKLLLKTINIPVNRTIAGDLNYAFEAFVLDNQVTNEAQNTIRELENDELREFAARFLRLVQTNIDYFKLLGFQIELISTLNAFLVEDGSVLLEWIFDDYRVGFSLEPNLEESSWYLVTNRILGNISAAGFLSEDNDETIFLWLLNFILSRT